MVEPKEYFCTDCKAFLSETLFSKCGSKTRCAFHYNKHRLPLKRLSPTTKKNSIIWQVAHNDAKRKFNNIIKLNSTDVRNILSRCNIQPDQQVRLLPLDPLQPISPTNFCITSLPARKEIVSFWLRTHCLDGYNGYVGPEAKRPIFGRSTN